MFAILSCTYSIIYSEKYGLYLGKIQPRVWSVQCPSYSKKMHWGWGWKIIGYIDYIFCFLFTRVYTAIGNKDAVILRKWKLTWFICNILLRHSFLHLSTSSDILLFIILRVSLRSNSSFFVFLHSIAHFLECRFESMEVVVNETYLVTKFMHY